MLPHDIRTLPDRRLVGLEHKGPYSELSRTYDQVGAVFGEQKWWPQARGMIAIYFDSPAEVAPEDLRSFAGVLVAEDFPNDDRLQEYRLPGGRHLIATAKGPYSDLPKAWEEIYATILPQTGERPAPRPAYESYLNSMLDTAPEDLLTEVCVPLSDDTR